jgi:hypothetical protein
MIAELKRLLGEATKVTNGPVRKERVHDLWVEVRAGFGFSNRMVADCMKEREADLYVFLRNNAEVMLAVCEAAETLPPEHKSMALKVALARLKESA